MPWHGLTTLEASLPRRARLARATRTAQRGTESGKKEKAKEAPCGSQEAVFYSRPTDTMSARHEVTDGRAVSAANYRRIYVLEALATRGIIAQQLIYLNKGGYLEAITSTKHI